MSTEDTPKGLVDPQSDWGRMNGETAKLVGSLLQGQIAETNRIQNLLEESARKDAIGMAQAFLELYRLVQEDQSLPRYTEKWISSLAGAAFKADILVASENSH